MSSCPIFNDGDELRGSGRSSVTPLFQHLISQWIIIVANAGVIVSIHYFTRGYKTVVF